MFEAARFNDMLNSALDGAVWLIASLPTAFIVWKGTGYWSRCNLPIVASLGLAVVAEAFALGFSE
jgi:hypothetical protein